MERALNQFLISVEMGGVHPRSITNLPDGTFDIGQLKELVRADDPHFPITSLVCIENTHNLKGGRVLPLEWIDQVSPNIFFNGFSKRYNRSIRKIKMESQFKDYGNFRQYWLCKKSLNDKK